MKRLLNAALALGLTLAVAGCMQAPQPSESVYARTEAMQVATVARCRVLEVRQVSLGADPANQSRSRWGQQAQPQPEAAAGALGGAIVGALIGGALGGEEGAKIGASLGSVGGAVAGQSQASKRLARAGIEYSILDASGQEKIVVQYHNPGDRIVPPGATCRIAGSRSGLRVLPGDHIAGQIARPATISY